MSAQIIDGKAIANQVRQQVKQRVEQRIATGQRAPGLAAIIVGDDPASAIYVRNKMRACEEVGIISTTHHLPEHAYQDDIENKINELNNDPSIDGILLQLPLPKHIDAEALLESIHIDKDVDGFHPYNIGRLVSRRPLLRPATPFGVMTMLETLGIDFHGKNAVIIGASNIVGRPMYLELLLAGCTVTTCHRFTKPETLKGHVQHADILVSATGRRGIVDSSWIKPGSIVVDVGIIRLEDGRIAGDIDFDIAKERAGFITPVPGGVGPMTVAALLQNTLYAAEALHNDE